MTPYGTIHWGSAVLKWIWEFLKRYVLFSVTVLAGARVYSWLFGYDNEVQAWTTENRPLIVLLLVLSAIMYGMYVWLDEEGK
jgi:hypothetical protein